MSLGAGGLEADVTFYRKGHIDAMITLADGGRFAVVRQGRALRRARLNDHLRAIHEYEYPRRPDVVLVLTPSAWERDLTTQYWMAKAFQGGYVAVESEDSLTRHDLPVWSRVKSVIGGVCSLAEVLAETSLGDHQQPAVSSARKRASMPDTEDMVRAAAVFGLSRDEKSMFEIVTDHPMIPRAHLLRWLGVSPARLSQIMRSLTTDWGLVVRRDKRPNFRYTLSAEGIRYVAYRDRTTLATTRGLWSTQPAAAPTKAGPYEGSLINEWATHTEHTDGITKLLSEFAAEARDAPDSAFLWSVPEWRSERKYHWNSRSIKPDAVGGRDHEGCSRPVLSRVRKARQAPGRNPAEARALRALLLVPRYEGRHAAVSCHPLRRGQRDHRGQLRADRRRDRTQAAHPGVVHAQAGGIRDPRTLMAAPLGTGLSPHPAVESRRLCLGQLL